MDQVQFQSYGNKKLLQAAVRFVFLIFTQTTK